MICTQKEKRNSIVKVDAWKTAMRLPFSYAEKITGCFDFLLDKYQLTLYYSISLLVH